MSTFVDRVRRDEYEKVNSCILLIYVNNDKYVIIKY